MIPRTLSASSLLVAEACLARWAAEYYGRASGMSGTAADVGTSFHGAAELYVKAVVLDKTHQPSEDLIVDFYKMSYIATFDNANFETPEFADGLELTKKWWKRTSFDGFTVLSAEQKHTFPIKTSAGEIPFNYIWDRCDDLGDGTIRVVDYKTIRLPISPNGLRQKIQPRMYGLAAQIQFPDAKRIKVEFDMIRHEGTVGCFFTREDNIATWRYLQKSAERIIAADELDPPEKLNPDCRYCVRKHNCVTLKKHVAGGGVLGISDVSEAVKRRAEIKYAQAAMAAMEADLDTIILQHAERIGEIQWEDEENGVEVKIAAMGRRQVDASRAAVVLGPELMRRYANLTLGNVDKLMKGDELNAEQKAELKSLITMGYGDPGVKITPLSPIGE